MAVQQVTPVTCPNCRVNFAAPIENIINGQDFEMKEAFLQGQFNIIRCPQCGFVGAPGVPILYYDLEKELALVHVPNELNLMGQTREKIVGDLTNRLFNSLPQEQRKFYLLNPTSFLTLESLIKAILQADGITEEMLQAQEERMHLLEELLKSPDEKTLKAKVQANDAKLDRQFFEILTAYMQTAQLMGDQEQAQSILSLRALISRWSSNGKQIVAEIDQELGIIVLKNQEEMLERLQNAANDQEFEALVAAGFAMLDYGFFQNLTNKIDQLAGSGDKNSAQALRQIRTKILDVKNKLEEANRVELEKASQVLQKIIEAKEPVATIEKSLDQINDAFFFILQANIEEAQRQKRDTVAKNLQAIGAIAVQKLQQQHQPQPPVEQAPSPPKIQIATR